MSPIVHVSLLATPPIVRVSLLEESRLTTKHTSKPSALVIAFSARPEDGIHPCDKADACQMASTLALRLGLSLGFLALLGFLG